MVEASQPKVSVVIPVLNVADKIERCLTAVFAQTHKPYEVILVDGHSRDDTVAKARKFPVTIINQDNGWAGAARQLGLEKASGEYIAFTDADCIPPVNWLEGLLNEFKLGITGVGGGIRNIGQGLWVQSINDVLGTFLGGGNSAQGRTLKNKRFEKDLNAFNSMYRRIDLVEAGGFNVHLSGADEAELGRRLQKRGKLLYTPNVIMVHDHGRGLKEFARNMYLYGRWRRECRAWALPVIAPLAVPLILLSTIFNYWGAVALLGLYLLVILATGLEFAFKHKDASYFLTVPVIYVTQHTLFSIGFWRELLYPGKKKV